MFKCFWNVKALHNAPLYFWWRMLLNKVPTKDKLINRGVQIGRNLYWLM